MRRRLLAVLGSLLLFGMLGQILDVAGVTPGNDGDITILATFAGFGLGMIVMACLDDD